METIEQIALRVAHEINPFGDHEHFVPELARRLMAEVTAQAEPVALIDEFAQFFSLVFLVSSTPRDKFNTDEQWALWMFRNVGAAFTLMQKFKAKLPSPSSDVEQDARRYRWLRAQHEGVETTEDADGFSHTEPAAQAFTVFMPGEEMHLEPVSCWPGNLDAAIDAAMTAEKENKRG